jgi:hypothetical protein
MRDLPNQFIRDRFGLGSSTRGKTMDEQNMGRSEAEFRAERVKPDEYWLNVWINTKDGSLVSELMFFSEADALENITAGYAGMTYLHTVHSLRRASGNIWDTWAIDMSDEAEAIAQDAECERRHNV